MRQEGFRVIIGNPPYLETAKLGGKYKVVNDDTENCRDIYAWFVERSRRLLNPIGRLGLIVPVSVASSDSFNNLRDVISSGSPLLWFAHFANRPGQLFSGAQNRLTIFLLARGHGSHVFSTRYHRWDAKNGERGHLLSTMQYTELADLARKYHGLFPKIGNEEAASVITKMLVQRPMSELLVKSSVWPIYWVRVPGYFCQFFLEEPMVKPDHGGSPRPRGELNVIYLVDNEHQRVLHAVLNSSTYLQFYNAYSDGRHVNPFDVKEFPFNYKRTTRDTRSRLVRLSKELELTMKRNTTWWRKSGLLIESVDSRQTKSTLDQIDRVLADHHGFTDAEFDYVTSLHLKHRMVEEVAE